MGNRESYGEDPLRQSKLVDSNEDFQIYESESGEEYEKYIVTNDGGQHFEKYYLFRITNRHSDLVSVLYAGSAHSFVGCTDRGKYQVITERIPYRLDSLTSIDPTNSLVILKTALRGFRDLYRKHGIFGIKDMMIGINSHNRVKVWLNHNFALNKPEETPSSFAELNEHDKEREMVHGILDLIDSKTEHSLLWNDLIHLKEVRNPCSFDEALNLVDYFSGANSLNISDHVTNIFNKKYSRQIKQPIPNTYTPIPRVYAQPPRDYRPVIAQNQQNTPQWNQPSLSHFQVTSNFPQINLRSIQQVESKLTIQRVNRNLASASNRPQEMGYKPYLIPTFANQNVYPINKTSFRPQIKFNTPRFHTYSIPPPTANFIASSNSINYNQIQNNLPMKGDPVPPYTAMQKSIQLNANESVNHESEVGEDVITFAGLPLAEDQSQGVGQEEQNQQNKQVQQSNSQQQEQQKQESREQQQRPLDSGQNALIARQADSHRLTVEPAYQIQVHEIKSEESLEEQISSIAENKDSEMNRQDLSSNAEEVSHPEYKIVLCLQNFNLDRDNEPKTLENLKTTINASLVDTRQIKRRTIELQQSNGKSDLKNQPIFKSQRNSTISYRQMRQLLLQELQN